VPRCHPEYGPRIGLELLQPQFIDQQRLDDDRALSNEPRPKPCIANEISEQFQIGIRREELSFPKIISVRSDDAIRTRLV
jgi:hypothetical protein